jgi:hypothetical protein
MTPEEEIIAFDAERWNPLEAKRLAPAWRALTAELADGKWHSWNPVIVAMLRESDILSKTADNLIRDAVKYGLLERRGEYQSAWGSRGKRMAHDSREVRIAPSAGDFRPDLFKTEPVRRRRNDA